MWSQLSENVALVLAFAQVLGGRDVGDLDAWVRLCREAAVVETVRQTWSNRQMEGQVNRLKLIKRQMYGREGFELLRAKVLHVS